MNDTPNPWRGETLLMLDGIAYVMRPGFEALVRIEQELSQSLMQLAQKLQDETMTLVELSVIIEYAMENRADSGFLRQAIVRNGLAAAMMAVTELLMRVFGGFDGIREESGGQAAVQLVPDY